MKSEQARAATMIRKELKANFPETKFSVTSSSFSMGDAVDISWTDGVTTEQVDAISKKYQYGSFNGMIDLYEHTNTRDDIPQSKYVQSHRSLSDELYLQAAQVIAADYKLEIPQSIQDLTKSTPSGEIGDCYNWYDVVRQVLWNMDLTGVKGIAVDETFECGSWYEAYKGVNE